MYKIDKKDSKIIYHLLNNSRQPLSILGKKVGLSREVVNYRITRLEKEGIIVEYPTIIDCGFLDWTIIRYYYTLQFVSPKKKQEIIEYFTNSDIVSWVSELEGSYDLQLNIYAEAVKKSIYPLKYQSIALKFLNFYDQTQKKYRKYIDEQILTVYNKSYFFDLVFLLGDKNIIPLCSSHFPYKELYIDKLDLEILHKLALNSRIPTVNLAHDLNITTATVTTRIKRLIDENVVWKFSAHIDWPKIGYRLYTVEINLKDYDKKYEIIEYIRKNQNIFWIYETFGRGVDLDFEFVFKDITQLHDIINDLSLKFPETIKNFRYYSHSKVHKQNHMPFK